MTTLDANTSAIDAHLAQFDDQIGVEDGEICNRCDEPDEDAPRGYKPTRCDGVMCQDNDENPYCDTCGEVA